MLNFLDAVDFRGGLLWFQFAYSMWQFVRVAKFCRLPYATLAHTFMWVIGRWGCPFTSRTYIVLEQGRAKFYVPPEVQDWILEEHGTTVVEDLSSGLGPHLRCLSVKAADYKLCGTEFDIQNSFVWNYLRDDPDCFAVASDLLWPGFAVLDRISLVDGLKMMCQGDYIPNTRTTRFLAVPDRAAELNQNLMRILSTIPLMAQAKGYDNLSLWVSLVIIIVDQFSLLFNKIWQVFKNMFVYLFKLFMLKTKCQPHTRELICTFFSTISKRMMYSDQVRMNFISVKKGDMVYTMSPFNLADFERVEMPHFESVRKAARPYNEEEFGVFWDNNGKENRFPEGTSIRSYYVDDSRIDVIFMEDGGFYNYVNNVALHMGGWKYQDDPEDTAGNFDNFLDLLHIMEEMQMLPLRQTEEDQFQSLHFNVFLSPGSSPKDLAFLVAKRDAIIGG